MKKIITIIVSVLLSGTVSFLGIAEENPEMNNKKTEGKYTFSENTVLEECYGLCFSIPETWNKEEKKVYDVSPERTSFYMTEDWHYGDPLLTVEERTMTLEDYLKEVRSFNNIDDYSEELMNSNGLETAEISFCFSSISPLTYDYCFAVQRDDNIVVRFTYEMHEDDAVSYLDDFYALCQTINIIENDEPETVQSGNKPIGHEMVDEDSQTNEIKKLFFTIRFGEFIEAYSNDDKLVIKAKITRSYSNEATIEQNYYNVCDIIRNQNGASYKNGIDYWAVADMTDGTEGKVISFHVPYDVVQYISENDFPDNSLGNYVTDLWILPSLK